MTDTERQDLWTLFTGKSVLVTGGTGSFGRAFVRRIFEVAEPARVIILSRDELKQYEMQQEAPYANNPRLRFFLGDVRDRSRLDVAFRDVDYVVHAAALKQVPAAEYNPFESIRTNVFGAENVIQAAQANRVKRVIALSTDKACTPINLYGASKLASDKLFVAANNMSGSAGTLFAVVRYGNVIGSRGSVIPFFQRLIAENADHLPITDPAMSRFWLTLDQGVDFVLSSFLKTRGGEIFVPKIPSMRITDLAEALAPNLPHRLVGIRPGEKLHEVMIVSDDARATVSLPDRYVIEPGFATFPRRSFAEDGHPTVATDFTYASHTNDCWLDADGLHKLLGTTHRMIA
jgi:UDP-N-acetylglucosamine 4,6-dehydratase